MSKAIAIRQSAEVGAAPQAQPAAMSPVYLGSIACPAHEVLDLGRKIALALADIILTQELYKDIGGKKHVYVEGWTTMGAMIGVTPREVSSVALDDGSYESVVELVRVSDGMVIGRASAICGHESPWNKREKYARRSMATTRATGKAFRLAFSWIMKLAGYDPCPTEEMPHGWGDSGSKEQAQAVAAEKLAEMRGANDQVLAQADADLAEIEAMASAEPPTPTLEPPAPAATAPRPKPKTLNYDFLQRMKVKASQLGRDRYYAVLGGMGYAHSNEITKPEAQEEAIKAMQQAVRDFLREIELGAGGKLYDKLPELFEDPEVVIAKANTLYHLGKRLKKGPAQVDAEVLLALESNMTYDECLKEYRGQIKAKEKP